MASLQAHMLDAIMRVQVKRRLTGVTELETARRILQSGSFPVPKRLTFTPATIGGIPGEWVDDPHVATIGTLFYLHGGGYFACSPQTHRPITGAYAALGFRVFAPQYRLAPEHPFPAAIEDAEAAWMGLTDSGYPAESLTISGDSAGGGLVLALLLTLRSNARQMPAAAALFSPWTDMAITGGSIASNVRREAMFWAPGLIKASEAYLAGASTRNPLASPLYGDLTGFPPTIIHVGDREVLRDDSTRLAARLLDAGCHVELKKWPVVAHVWQMAQFVPEARISMHEVARFLVAHCSPDPTGLNA